MGRILAFWKLTAQLAIGERLAIQSFMQLLRPGYTERPQFQAGLWLGAICLDSGQWSVDGSDVCHLQTWT